MFGRWLAETPWKGCTDANHDRDRALGSCTVWHLALKDIHTLTHVYPEVLPAMVDAFTDRWEIRLQAMGPDSR